MELDRLIETVEEAIVTVEENSAYDIERIVLDAFDDVLLFLRALKNTR